LDQLTLKGKEFRHIFHEYIRDLLALRGDVGARELLKSAIAIDLPGGELDIDTPQDLERAFKMYST
jgi:CTP:molybdopterin cytidylyltransferase MocA